MGDERQGKMSWDEHNNLHFSCSSRDDLAGNRKDVCVKEAKAEFVKGNAHAKGDRIGRCAPGRGHEAG
jgi:hypothetical protein